MVNIVIGAAFGDEGKGLMTDYFMRDKTKASLGVRHNGGAQAGHTVVHDGKRHVFQHFSAATFQNADTLLARNFIVNPAMFFLEYNDLLKMNIRMPKVFINEDAKLTTVLDMLYNRYQELSRGTDKHGSCGLGINATVSRYEYDDKNSSLITACFLTDYYEHPIKMWSSIVAYYAEIGFTIDEIRKVAPNFSFDTAFALYQQDLEFMKHNSEIIFIDSDLLKDYENIVFEGAQGLMLDEKFGQFPYVTRSRTGLKNCIGTLTEPFSKSCDIEITYVTRAYATRHGAGPFWDDPKTVLDHFNVNDPTNIPNDWQDSLRLGVLDIKELFSAILQDLSEVYNGKPVRENINDATISLAITCLNQAKTNMIPIRDENSQNQFRLVDINQLMTELNDMSNGLFKKFYLVNDHNDVRVDDANFI